MCILVYVERVLFSLVNSSLYFRLGNKIVFFCFAVSVVGAFFLNPDFNPC